MKLQNEFAQVKAKIGKIKGVYEYAQKLKTASGYENFLNRLAWDVGRCAIGTETICEWYDKYDCNDTHIGTLFKKALLEVYPEVASI